ncbi:MAG: glycolate oxidase subunit GlcF [Rhodospirillaceae bacterium]|nr:glycolate oxidase subunit GlcF [Rhodospirillaceae bacterium]
MQTSFTPAQLTDPDIESVNGILRSCVHCGFCTATCPTYVLLGDELDSPRGRIYQMKSFIEEDRVPTDEEVKHIDRCLSCLSCMTTCPPSVHYMHLVDHGRAHIARTYHRPLLDRLTRTFIGFVLPRPGLFRWALIGGSLVRPIRNLMPNRLKTMLNLLPASVPSPGWVDRKETYPASNAAISEQSSCEPAKARVALLSGCAQQVLGPHVNEATVRLLNRLGVEVVVTNPKGCCGALVHHMGQTEASHNQAKAMIDAWIVEADDKGLDAVIINASGCGTTVKDYGYMFRNDPDYSEKAARVAALTQDITEFLTTLDMSEVSAPEDLSVTYHSACSMQHGQQIKAAPLDLLLMAGFAVKEPAESHLCCGSAGTYNMLQPEIASQLKKRKIANLRMTQPDIIATGNIGCMMQLSSLKGEGAVVPVVHTVELLDWAAGGPRPLGMSTG